MKIHSTSANSNVQESGCAALQKLAGENEDKKVTSAEEGGINTFLSVMKFHLDNDNLQP
jgi:hypothetical protein